MRTYTKRFRDVQTKGSEDIFIQGVACGIAVVVYSEGVGTYTEEALRACGIHSVKDLREAGVCDYDIDILRDSIKEIQSKDRRRKRGSHESRN